MLLIGQSILLAQDECYHRAKAEAGLTYSRYAALRICNGAKEQHHRDRAVCAPHTCGDSREAIHPAGETCHRLRSQMICHVGGDPDFYDQEWKVDISNASICLNHHTPSIVLAFNPLRPCTPDCRALSWNL